MTEGDSWPLPALLLGARLKTLRGRRPQNSLAKKTGYSPTLYSRIEAGAVRIDKPEAIALILKELGVPAGPEFDQLMSLARDASVPGWASSFRTAYRDAVPESMVRLSELESRATSLYSVETAFVPGLLQSDAYRTAVTEWTLLPSQRRLAERVVELRTERTRRFLAAKPPSSVFFLRESVLRQVIGSRELMVEQLELLLTYAETSRIGVRIIPMDLPLALQVSSVTRLDFEDQLFAVPSVIYNEWAGRGDYYRGPLDGETSSDEFRDFRFVIDTAARLAPGREDSRRLITEALKAHRSHL
ncbi:helix-turn-helix domain-containing protein [Kitasatospora sp. CB01950]|uniref:helix-turn-helix domain-containing protein n=1 Tax=Kitasatospora sp. CB01950 TaxID=1703930 RepID=UPI00093F4FA8|nr:helix-turn-helix transcriptional regulator [Kitasatospora sp. CB01950]